MREILFRGKRLTNGEWVEGDHLAGGWDFDSAIRAKTGEMTYEIVAVAPTTVGQYTGLEDKNGKRIFEGDIIKIPDDYDEYGHNAGEIYEVYFLFGGFRLKPKYSRARGFWLEDDKTVEAIGNIHDDPGLLGGDKDG